MVSSMDDFQHDASLENIDEVPKNAGEEAQHGSFMQVTSWQNVRQTDENQ